MAALPALEREGHFQLPPRRQKVASQRRPRRLSEPVPEPQEVPESAGDIRRLRLIEVRPDDDAAMRTWNELVAGEHPQVLTLLASRRIVQVGRP